ncbi:sugar ABC transporter substrate-binding protein [uncultured Amnibacterium sp.]|uniref:sugar ABC transporter substrate-binding protein n=1 Tax=uncultured Amnibacterium sp. TaxID=1631851 RepID=UPI0035CA7CEF
MSQQFKSRPKRLARLAGLAVMSSAALALSACGASGGTSPASTSSAVPAAVTAAVTSHLHAAPLDYPGTKFDASPARGKTVWWITHEAQNPVLAVLGDNFKAALGRVGVKVVACDGKSNPVDENNCFSQAIAQKADLIQIDGSGTPATYQNSLTKAKAAGIPVLAGASVDASDPLYAGLSGQSSQAFKLNGKLIADWIIRDSKADAHVLFLTVPDVDGSVEEQKAFSAELKAQCPACSATVTGVTLANWASDLATTVNASLLRNPKIDYVAPAFDPMTQFTNPAIQQAGKASTVKVVSSAGSEQPMKDMQQGGGVNAANIGIDIYGWGFIEADLALRALVGAPTVKNAIAPTRIFDASNIKGLTIDGKSFASGAWYRDPSKTSEFFDSLWGLK